MKPDASRTVYDGNLIDVTLERWGEHEREIVDHPGAVAIVAIDRDGMLTLVRQRREAVRAELLELPAGTLEEGEKPLECARRELEEEAGLTGGTWHEAAAFYTTPGFCRERMHLFFAEELEPGDTVRKVTKSSRSCTGRERTSRRRWARSRTPRRSRGCSSISTEMRRARFTR
jgi:ADP-ribose pyrophosphatase YjhB (NUDIX family)